MPTLGADTGVPLSSRIVKKVRKSPGQSFLGVFIFKLVAHYWGCKEVFREWREPEDVFQTLKDLSRGQPCDITGIRDYRMIDEASGIQWPFEEATNERRLFEDGKFYHEDSRATFIFESPRGMLESPNEEFPYLLLTGRGTASQTRTKQSAVLR